LKLDRAAASYWMPRERKPKNRPKYEDNSDRKQLRPDPPNAAAKIWRCRASFSIVHRAFEFVLRLCGYGIWKSTNRTRSDWYFKPNQDCFTKITTKPVISIPRPAAGRNINGKTREHHPHPVLGDSRPLAGDCQTKKPIRAGLDDP